MTMLLYLIVYILVQLQLAGAQYGTATSEESSSTTTSSMEMSTPSTVQKVDVGEHGFTFDPDTLQVAPGGKVEFHFYPGNHSVAQASFDRPCHPMSDSSFFSGFVAPPTGESVCSNQLPSVIGCLRYDIGHCLYGNRE